MTDLGALTSRPPLPPGEGEVAIREKPMGEEHVRVNAAEFDDVVEKQEFDRVRRSCLANVAQQANKKPEMAAPTSYRRIHRRFLLR